MKIEKEIVQESLRFVRENKNVILGEQEGCKHFYQSPRISSEFMDCSMPMTFDSFSHCSLGCTYCFSYSQKANNSSFSHKLHGIDYKKLIRAINGEDPKDGHLGGMQRHFFNKRFLLHWGGMADPFCNFEKTNRIGYRIIRALGKAAYPTLFSFKGDTLFQPDYQKLLSRYAHQKNFAFQVSIISPSDEMSRKVEIGVPVTSKRIEAIKLLNEMGFYTILRLRPFIIGITDDGLLELLHRCKEAGIKAISTEFVAIDLRSTEGLRKRHKWLGELIGTKDVAKYFKTLSPSERGGYLRLNRLVKEPHVKLMYKFCLENDILFACSDPDYKELNQSGSCCGMPDKYPENQELENWTKNQLTYHLKEARRLYHLRGRISQFKFEKVFNTKEDTYLKEKAFSQDHIVVSQMTASERYGLEYITIARRVWNNLNSPGNPRNYFHGKIMPIRTDNNGDLVYVYKPSEYEKRWKDEGINLER
jgi:DNA repair photolyase